MVSLPSMKKKSFGFFQMCDLFIFGVFYVIPSVMVGHWLLQIQEVKPWIRGQLHLDEILFLPRFLFHFDFSYVKNSHSSLHNKSTLISQ